MKEITNIMPKRAFSPYSSFLKGCLFALLITSLCLFSNCKNDGDGDKKNDSASDYILSNKSMQTKCEAKAGGGSKKVEYIFKSANSGDSKAYTYSSSDCSGSVDAASIETKPFRYDRVPDVPIKVDGDPTTSLQISITLEGEDDPVEMYYVPGADSGASTDLIYVSGDHTNFDSDHAMIVIASDFKTPNAPAVCGYDLSAFNFRLHASLPAYYLPAEKTSTSFSRSFRSSAARRWAIINLKDVNVGDKLVFSFDPRLTTSLNHPTDTFRITLAYTSGWIAGGLCFVNDSNNGDGKFDLDSGTLKKRNPDRIGYSYSASEKTITFTQAASYYHIVVSLASLPSDPIAKRL